MDGIIISYSISIIFVLSAYLFYSNIISPRLFYKRLNKLIIRRNWINIYKLVRKYRNNFRIKNIALLYELIMNLHWERFNEIKARYYKLDFQKIKNQSYYTGLYSTIIVTLYLLNQIDLARAMTDKLKNTTNNALELISAIDDYCSMNFDKSKSILSQLIFNDNEPYKDFYNAAIAYCLGMMYVDSNKNESLSNFERAKNLSPDTEIFKLSENMLRLIRESGDGNG